MLFRSLSDDDFDAELARLLDGDQPGDEPGDQPGDEPPAPA